MAQRNHRLSLRLRGSLILNYISTMHHGEAARPAAPTPFEPKLVTEALPVASATSKNSHLSSQRDSKIATKGSRPQISTEEKRTHAGKRARDAKDVEFFATVRKCKIDYGLLGEIFKQSNVTTWEGFARRKIEGAGRCKMPIGAVTDGTYDGTFVETDVRLFVCYLQLVGADARYFWILKADEQERLERYWSIFGDRPKDLSRPGSRSSG
jgi:hypothetical protein